MRDLNKVQLIGHLGHAPEVRYLDNGTALTTFNVATHHSYATGEERQTETEWHRVTAWGKLGELCAQYIHKGAHVYVEGRFRTHRWEDESGQLRTIVEIVIHDMILLDRRAAPLVPQDDHDDDLRLLGTGVARGGHACPPPSPPSSPVRPEPRDHESDQATGVRR